MHFYIILLKVFKLSPRLGIQYLLYVRGLEILITLKCYIFWMPHNSERIFFKSMSRKLNTFCQIGYIKSICFLSSTP